MTWVCWERIIAAQARPNESLRCSTGAYGAALPRAAENATMQGFPRRAPTLTAAGEVTRLHVARRWRRPSP